MLFSAMISQKSLYYKTLSNFEDFLYKICARNAGIFLSLSGPPPFPSCMRTNTTPC